MNNCKYTENRVSAKKSMVPKEGRNREDVNKLYVNESQKELTNRKYQQ